MRYKKKDLLLSDKETLVEVINELQLKLRAKNAALKKTQSKLVEARGKVLKMKDTVQFQRRRIVELYSTTPNRI
jgi:hypothetical protein